MIFKNLNSNKVKTSATLLTVLSLVSFSLKAQNETGGVKIGADNSAPHSSAILELESTEKGMLFPRMTMAQRDGISPVIGLVVYVTDAGNEGLYVYKAGGWASMAADDAYWNISTTAGGIYTNYAHLGVGTSNPKEDLQLGSDFTIHNGGSIFLGYNNYWDGFDKKLVDGHSGVLRFDKDGDIHLQNSGDGNANTGSGLQTRMTVASSGHVSINAQGLHDLGSSALSVVGGVDINSRFSSPVNRALTIRKENLELFSITYAGAGNVMIEGATGVNFGQHVSFFDNVGFSSDVDFGSGVDIDNSGNDFTVASAANFKVSGATYPNAPSDRRLKENIHRIDGALDKIMSIDGVRYNMRSMPQVLEAVENGNSMMPHLKAEVAEEYSIGVIAQDVRKVFPESVKMQESGYYSVNYQSLIAPMIEAMKEQQEMIDNQQKLIEELEARLSALEKK